MAKRLTIMVVPDGATSVRRYRISKRTFKFLVWSSIVFLVLMIGGAVAGVLFYRSVSNQLDENQRLKSENVKLRTDLVRVHEKVAGAQTILDRIKLRGLGRRGGGRDRGRGFAVPSRCVRRGRCPSPR